MFILSDAPLPGQQPAGPVWISHGGDAVHIEHDASGGVFVFDGSLVPDAGLTARDLARQWYGGTADLRKFKGRYAGAYVEPGTGRVSAFSDHLGIHNLYLWRGSGRFALASDFAALLQALPPEARALDHDAAAEWRVLGFTVAGRTFARSVSQLPPGAVTTVPRRGDTIDIRPFWRYEMVPAYRTAGEAVDTIHARLETATARWLGEAGAGRRWVLGLSGGLDSRVVATLARRAGADVTAYFFGERNSDAGAAAGLAADRLGLPLRYLGANRQLHRHFADCIHYQPLADLEWAKYVTGRDRLPAYDSLWSGRLGDHLLAESETLLVGPDDDRLLAEALFRHFAHEPCDPSTREAIVSRIANHLATFGGSTAQRRQAFSFYNHERSVQHCGLFHDFGRHPHFSPFEDIEVVEATLGIPPPWRARNRLYRLLVDRHLPEVAETAVPIHDRGNGHKPVESWLRGNGGFARAVLDLVPGLDDGTAVPCEPAGLRSSLGAIVAGRASRREIHRFFRRLTVAAFVKTYLT